MNTRDKFFGEGVRRRWELIQDCFEREESPYELMRAFEQYIEGLDRKLEEAYEILNLTEDDYRQACVSGCLLAADEKWEELMSSIKNDDPESDARASIEMGGDVREATFAFRRTKLRKFEFYLNETGLDRENALGMIGLTPFQVQQIISRHIPPPPPPTPGLDGPNYGA